MAAEPAQRRVTGQTESRTRRPRRRPGHAGGPDSGKSEEGMNALARRHVPRLARGSGAPRLRCGHRGRAPPRRPGVPRFFVLPPSSASRACARIGRESPTRKPFGHRFSDRLHPNVLDGAFANPLRLADRNGSPSVGRSHKNLDSTFREQALDARAA
jgi:hypothetical protein